MRKGKKNIYSPHPSKGWVTPSMNQERVDS